MMTVIGFPFFYKRIQITASFRSQTGLRNAVVRQALTGMVPAPSQAWEPVVG